MKNKIGVFDSGRGGSTTLEEIKKILPNENYIYYADSKNNPYGEKDDTALLDIVSEIVDFFILKDVKLIVIACNTATTRTIEKLRVMYPNMHFVGTEPAIKVACDNNYKNTLVMATPLTINSSKVRALINKNLKDDECIYLLPCDGLANAIETNNEKEINNILDKLLIYYKNKNIDAVVLGCTHYPIIKDKIQNYFPYAKIIDGNIGVAKRVKSILEQNNIINTTGNKEDLEFIQTKKEN